MADKTIGELNLLVGDVAADAKLEGEAADGTASFRFTAQQLAGSAVFTDAFGTPGGLDAHLTDEVGAHAASAVSVEDVAENLTADNVEDALAELAGLIPSGYTDEQARDAIGSTLVAGEGIDITVNDGSDTITIDAELASDTNPGVAEAATIAETNTGTDAARYVTPDGLAGSIFGTESVSIQAITAATAVTTGDGKFYFRIPTALNGMNLITVAASVFAKSTSGDPTIQLARGRQSSATSAHSFVDMLSTRITIDANDFDSKDAAAAAVIDTSNDDVATGDLIRVDVDTAGTGTTGLFMTMGFRLP